MAILAFFQDTPGLAGVPGTTGAFDGSEVGRVGMSFALARNLVDIMARNLDYYPTKPTEGAT